MKFSLFMMPCHHPDENPTLAFQRDIEPFAVADAQADFNRPRHDMAMSMVAATCGVVTQTDALLATLTA